MNSDLIINSTPVETRVALIENGSISDLLVERNRDKGLVGSIYKGRIIRVLPGMQASFVDIGLDRAAFLYVGDIRDDSAPAHDLLIDEEDEKNNNDHEENDAEESGISRPPAPKAQIQDLVKEGQEILVQVAKDPIGTKGARITMHISLPGRNVVYMPTVAHIGISRRIEREEERKRLKEIVTSLRPPEGGFIVRTACDGVSQKNIKNDMEFLTKLWKEIQRNYEKRSGAGLVHADLDVELRAVRDLFTEDVKRLVVDDPKAHKKVIKFINQFMPKLKSNVELYEGKEPIFDHFGIELEISRALGRKVWLKSGGYIIIDEAEALVAIDVNTGRYVGKRNLEDTITKTNLEAVKEIAYQLRLRNCGGIIILDFIDMEKESNRDKIITTLKEELSKDRAKTNVLNMSSLGIVEMTRKRTRESLVRSSVNPAPTATERVLLKVRPPSVMKSFGSFTGTKTTHSRRSLKCMSILTSRTGFMMRSAKCLKRLKKILRAKSSSKRKTLFTWNNSKFSQDIDKTQCFVAFTCVLDLRDKCVATPTDNMFGGLSQMYAVVKTSGRQYRIAAGESFSVEKLVGALAQPSRSKKF